MRGYISKIRPAGSAIVAVLALNSTYGYAQDAVLDIAPPLVAPPTVSVPIIAAPVSPPADLSTDAATPQPMVQPTAPIQERIAAARAAAEQEAAEQSAKSATISQAAPIARPARAEVPTVPPPIERTVEAAPQPEAPVAVMAPDQATAATEPVVTRADENAAMNDWILPTALGGGALLLLGLGAAAVSRRRRRGTRGETVSDQVVYNDQPVAAPVRPTAAPVPAANLASAGVGGGLAAMVAAPPSPENPFLTPRKRMVRARFLLAQQEKAAAGQKAAINDVAPPQAVHAEPQMQTVYRMGAGRKRGMTFKPQTR